MKKQFLAVLAATAITMPAATLASNAIARLTKFAPLEMQRIAQQATIFRRSIQTPPNPTETMTSKCPAKKVLTHALAFGCGTIFGAGIVVSDIINKFNSR